MHEELVSARLQPHRLRNFTIGPDPEFEALRTLEVATGCVIKWATAHPIRCACDLAHFLNPQGLYSDR